MPKRKSTPLMVLEVPKEDLRPLGSSKELSAAVLTLEHHLGFQELCRRMRLAKAMTQSKLNNDDEVDVKACRAMIKAYGFMEQQLKLEMGRPQIAAPREAFEDERREYERVREALQIVGQTN